MGWMPQRLGRVCAWESMTNTEASLLSHTSSLAPETRILALQVVANSSAEFCGFHL